MCGGQQGEITQSFNRSKHDGALTHRNNREKRFASDISFSQGRVVPSL